MTSIERTVEVDQPVDVVWRFLSDFTTSEQWEPATVSTVRTHGDGGVGTVYHNVSKILGHETEVEYVVTEVRPESLLRLTGTANGMQLLDTMTFEQTATGTRVTYRAEFNPQGAAKLVTPLLPLGLKKLGDDAAEQMEKVLSRL